MVCHHDIHMTPRARSGWIRAAPREVSKWFHDLSLPNRVEFFCGLLQLCTPIELRFYGSCLEELARLHYDELRELDRESNSVIDPKGEDCLVSLFRSPSSVDYTVVLDSSKFDMRRMDLNQLPSSFHILTEDSLLRSKLILRLALLRSANTVSAHAYFEALMTDSGSPTSATILPHNRDQTRLGGSASYPVFSSIWSNGASSDESEDESIRSGRLSANELKVVEEILLIYTLAAFHPAFTFDQRQRLYTYLAALRLWSDALRGAHLKHSRTSISQACPHNADAPDPGLRHPMQEASQKYPFELRRSTLKATCSSSLTCHSVRCRRRFRTNSHRRCFHSLSLEDLALLEVSLQTQFELHPGHLGDTHVAVCSRITDPASGVPLCRRGRSGAISRNGDKSVFTLPLPSARCSSCKASRQTTPQNTDSKQLSGRKCDRCQEPCKCDSERTRFSLDSFDDSAVSQISSTTETDSTCSQPYIESHVTEAGNSSDELNSTSSRTLTASDRVSVLRDLVLSTNDLSLSQRNPRRTDRRDPLGGSSSHTTGPSAARFDPSDADIGLPHFGMGKHTKDVTEYCRMAPKRHSSGSSPISTPPSEDSGSETVALTTSLTSCYWDRKNPSRFTAIPSTCSSSTLTQSTCPMCHQCITRCIPSTQVCITETAHNTTPFTSIPDVSNLVTITQDLPVSITTPTKHQGNHSGSSETEVPQRDHPLRLFNCTYCHQTSSHSNCILSTSPGSEHLNCCHNHNGASRSNPTDHHHQNTNSCHGQETVRPPTEIADIKQSAADNMKTQTIDGPLREARLPTQVHFTTDHSRVQQQMPIKTRSTGPGNDKTKPCDDDQQQRPVSSDPTVAAVTPKGTLYEAGTMLTAEQTNLISAAYSLRTPVVTSSTVFRFPPPLWSPTNTNFHLLGPSFYAQSYMMPASSLWVASSPPPGAQWAVHSPGAAFPIPPMQLASLSDPTAVESKEDETPIDSVYSPANLCDECTTLVSSDSSDCASTIDPSARNNHSGTKSEPTHPPSAVIPPTHTIPPQTFVMFCPSGPLDFLRTGLLSVDLTSGQPLQYIPLNCAINIAQSTTSVDGGQGEAVDACSPVETFSSGDTNTSVPSTVTLPATTNGTCMIPPLSSLSPHPVSMDRPRGPSSNGHRVTLSQPPLLGPYKTRPSMAVDSPAVTMNDLMQPIASWVSTDVHPNFIWPTPVNGIQQTPQPRLVFRRELATYLPSALSLRCGPNYQNRGFHPAMSTTPGHAPFLSPILNGTFPTRSFLHPSTGNVVSGSNTIFYHQNLVPAASFSQTSVSTSFAAHVSSTQSPASTSFITTQSNTSFLSNFPGHLFVHPPSDLPSSFPHPPPSVAFTSTSSSAASAVNPSSVDSTASMSFSVSIAIAPGSVNSPDISTSSSAPPTLETEVGSTSHASHLGLVRTTIPCSNQTVAVTVSSTTTSNSSAAGVSNLAATGTPSVTSSVPAPPFLPNFYIHQPPLLPPPPPPHLNYFLPQGAPLVPPHGQHPNPPIPLWATLPMTAAVAPSLGSHTVNSRYTSCFNCGQPGHKAKYCPSRLPNQQAMENTFNLSYAPSK